MLSILHVLPSLKLGGAERFTIELAQLQREQGLDAQILSLNSTDDFLVAAAREKQIPVFVCARRDARLKKLRYINNLLKQYDVIHLHSPRILQYLFPFFLLNPGKKLIYTRHGLNPLKGMYMHIMHFLMKPYVSHITFVTQSGCDVFKRNYTWPERMISVIENGALIPAEYTISSALPLRFGSVGRMVELKGQKLLLRALLQLQSEVQAQPCASYQLHFYGAGPVESELRESASNISNGEIFFHGQVTDVASIYADIDVLVVSSRIEGLSMVIIEAMARGIPVIATAVGGNPTLVKDGVTGILVEYGDITALKTAIRQFLDNPELVQLYGEAARKLVSGQYSLVNTHRKFLERYQS